MIWLDGSELDISNMTAEELLDRMCRELWDYEYEDWKRMPEWAQNAAFIAAFDTELNMEGIFTFLENTIGHYAPEIIHAFRAIGDEEDADTLEEISRLAPPDAMRGEWTEKDYQQYDITSFNADHTLSDETAERIEELEQQLYLNTDRDMWERFYAYVGSSMKAQ